VGESAGEANKQNKSTLICIQNPGRGPSTSSPIIRRTITPHPPGISKGVFMVTISVPLTQLTNDQRTPAVLSEQATVILWRIILAFTR